MMSPGGGTCMQRGHVLGAALSRKRGRAVRRTLTLQNYNQHVRIRTAWARAVKMLLQQHAVVVASTACGMSSLAHGQRLFPPVSAPFQPRIVGFSLVPLDQFPYVGRSRIHALRDPPARPCSGYQTAFYRGHTRTAKRHAPDAAGAALCFAQYMSAVLELELVSQFPRRHRRNGY